jgi:SAM-dependent methyltransferase
MTMDEDRPAADHPDRVRWNARYRDHAPPRPARLPLLAEALAAGIPEGPVLELACGASASALALAEMGRSVSAVDISDVALELLHRAARELGVDERIDLSRRDLYAYRPPTRAFALVLCTSFWDPMVFAAGCDAARVGGVVAWETFLHDPAEGEPPPIDPRYCLAPGEPASRLLPGFRVLGQSVHGEPGRRRVAMLARREAGISFAAPWLAIGGAIRDEEDVRELLDAGISHVINCQVRVDDAPLLAGRAAYLWNPAEDDGEPKPAAWFLRAVEFARRARQDPDAHVLVHCAEGRARGPAVAYGILRAAGYGPDDAERAVLAARPTALLRYRDDADRALRSR